MNDFFEWLQDITIYHKENNEYKRYNIKAFIKNTSIQNRNTTGVNSVDNAVIRVFDTDSYNIAWKVDKGDIIVNKKVEDIIVNAPLTELTKKYGKENVYQVKSIDKLIYTDLELDNHIKIGAI